MRSQLVFFSVLQAAGFVTALWEQCGGIGWSGSNACPVGETCSIINPYYAQCLLPITPPGPTSRLTTTTACTTSNLCSVYPGCCGTSRTACASYCIGQPTPTITVTTVSCSPCPTSRPITTTGCTTANLCSVYPGCCGSLKTACASYCIGQPQPTITVTTVSCSSCPTMTTITTPPPSTITTPPVSTGCPKTKTCIQFPWCCGAIKSECIAYCVTSSPPILIPTSTIPPCSCNSSGVGGHSVTGCLSSATTCLGYDCKYSKTPLTHSLT
ncbi:hypothetical protein TWF694_008225 [Orbilia ellipsospora]|uniref:CBM1 domain-containing protein n=1 Tax=Orbilia ellipsospora TaxID=2528407 RepID=A0AAV9XGF6_9PEZI